MAAARRIQPAAKHTRSPAPSIGGWRRHASVAWPYLVPIGVASAAAATGWASPLTLSAVAIATAIGASVRAGIECVRIDLQRERLDAWIITRGGEVPVASDLSARVEELRSERLRGALATTLWRIATAAVATGGPGAARARRARRALQPFVGDLLALAEQLRDIQHPLSPRAVALANRLVRHAESPIYSTRPDPALTMALRDIQLELCHA